MTKKHPKMKGQGVLSPKFCPKFIIWSENKDKKKELFLHVDSIYFAF